MDDFNNKKLEFEDRVIADQVADEILTVEEDDNRGLFFLLLLFLICLIFLVSSLSFAIFNTYYNGDSTNVIDVGTDIVVNHTKDEDNKDKPKKDDSGSNNTEKKKKKPSREIEAGSILFSFNEKSNNIYMTNVYPTADEVGKTLTGDKEYFDFSISAFFKNINSGKIVYEISLIPIAGNTLSTDDIRVYLTEDGKDVSINNNIVNTYSGLPNSKYRENGKVIYRKTVSKNNVSDYVFRMWLSSSANVSKVSKQFGCKVAVDAYYE